jgi:hypothetical protein
MTFGAIESSFQDSYKVLFSSFLLSYFFSRSPIEFVVNSSGANPKLCAVL